MRFRVVLVGDCFTQEDENIEKARKEAEVQLEEQMKGLTNFRVDTLQTMNEVRGL